MKIAVIGANGQLGSDISEEFKKSGFEVIELNHSDIEISDLDSVSNVLQSIKAGIVINTAAMHNVEKCEAEPAASFSINAIGARNLAMVCNDAASVLVHISTDYVFDGKKHSPYVEADKTAPLNVYGNTKVSGEQFVEAIAKKYFVVRTSGIYGRNPCRAKEGLNFTELMLKLAIEKPEIRVVNDEFLTPTSTKEVSRQMVSLIKTDAWGLYHATAEGSCSWYEFAKKIFELSSIKTNLNIANPDEFPMKVPRPKYSVLENENLKKLGINIFKKWDHGLKEYIESRQAH
ncbi:MAG: dTDP-4-dehydrorhamnose reductase [Chlorobi bacterium]|nr:dTDP-4-dehydrorhamnose reductase [Chlorobiota bacterium]MCI0716544.1 dTDP-4-dehydrorhamnose reductase [Chlorobiota bacterium]